ncbi:hypothetical protein RQP46_007539 [Phenoliferia psychrophenolica]
MFGTRTGLYLAAKDPSKVIKLILSSTEPRSRAPEILQFIFGDFTALLVSNKDGKGDGTGTIPDAAMGVLRDACLGVSRVRLLDHGTNMPSGDVSFYPLFAGPSSMPTESR